MPQFFSVSFLINGTFFCGVDTAANQSSIDMKGVFVPLLMFNSQKRQSCPEQAPIRTYPSRTDSTTTCTLFHPPEPSPAQCYIRSSTGIRRSPLATIPYATNPSSSAFPPTTNTYSGSMAYPRVLSSSIPRNTKSYMATTTGKQTENIMDPSSVPLLHPPGHSTDTMLYSHLVQTVPSTVSLFYPVKTYRKFD